MKQRFLRAEYLELRTMLSASQPLVPAVDDVQTSNVDVLTTSADDANGQVASPLTTVAGDFNADNIIDAIDIDMLCAAMGNHVESGFDLTADGLVDKQDMDMLIHDIIGTEYGDANLNGFVSTNDLRYLFNNLFSSSGGWAAGDFSCDGIVDGADFIVWNQFKGVQTPLSTRLLAAGST